ncbi:MAG: hypothetical protein JWP31_1625, partial [Aeromicrobium sp.]|nr:hypothetical protein [Aeromicrobium sp.]
NDFHVDEWAATAPERYIPVCIVPTWDIELATAELYRAAANGARTVSFPDSPVPLGMPSFHSPLWDPFWKACEETGTVLSLHFGSSGYVPGFSFSGVTASQDGMKVLPDAPFAVAITTFGTNLMWSTIDLLFSPMLRKFPGLKVSLAEGGIGWIPYVLERADFVWERHRHYMKTIDFDTRPSDLYKQSIWGCFIDDEFGVINRHAVGVDKMMLEIDYPHSDSNWPNSRKRATEVLADVPDDEVQRITEDNARELFNFPRTS